ncbi:MAG: ribbon-helix-helix protein, CopG family [Clostridia bacterium]|nr:ribbon-helix-helix protein, CopG family [Clostridia bacterium]MBQ2707779.1 ribbon-helix-helix protein, CopG family [Clostridia bacterium]
MADEKLIIKPKQLRGEDGYKVFSIRIREETVSKIDDIAAKTGRSRNELIGMFLNFAVEHCEIEEES